MESESFVYEGSELDLFAGAENWRRYWTSVIQPFLGSRILEVGAGIGSATRVLGRSGMQWVALEPDPTLARRIGDQKRELDLDVIVGTLSDVPVERRFDSILYIDVLEHVEDDTGEVDRASQFLDQGGRLIILGPAHQWLFTDFDASIGHFRRYSRRDLRALKPRGVTEVASGYLDSVGILASSANKLFLRSASPSRQQIQLWDRLMVPASRHLDRLARRSLGKSVFVVWQKD